jgi:hypothetical protein
MDTLYRREVILGMITGHGNTITVWPALRNRLLQITNIDVVSTRSAQRDQDEVPYRFPMVSRLFWNGAGWRGICGAAPGKLSAHD